MDLQDKRVIDSGYSRYMTWNMSYLTDYEEIDGGYVAFGGNSKRGKITGKCTIKTVTLDFENVYFANLMVRLMKVFFVGYSLNSKAFRVFNSRKRIVEENLQIRFSENTPNVVGSRPDWLFDIDALTRTMNDKPIVACTQSNDFADLKSSHDDGFKPSIDDRKKVAEDPSKESECKDSEKKDNVNSTKNVNVVGINEVNATGGKTSIELPDDPNMPALEDISTFNFSSNHEDDDAVADMNNLDTTIQNFVVYQMDVNSAFLNGKIKEEVYVCPPLGFEDLNFYDRVYKVEKALYGLHQAPRS
nr:retrovirus-related Pol polyprotein from transposon TNT 1-94 [Tanacetum cinerariifolium]